MQQGSVQDTFSALEWPAPAKLNLFLHITGRRADGYHELQTVFQFLDQADRLRFEPRNDAHIEMAQVLPGVSAEQNLCLRAARLLQQAAGSRQGVTIHLDKRLPLGAGLGGGSSDAATVLVVLNQLWGINFSAARLLELGLRLGADVPVFIHGQAAWAEGIGERLQPIEPAERPYLVVIPAVTVSTAEIFAAPELTRNTPPITIADFLSGVGHNDCEPLVRVRYPAVAEALDWLNAYAPARLTGTGACVFAAFERRAQALAALAQLPPRWRGFVAQSCNRSPLQRQLERYRCQLPA